MAVNNPIWRKPALVAFSKDHHFGLLLVWKIRQGLDLKVGVNRIASYINFFFKEHLEEHFREEEDLLFDQLDPKAELRKRAEKEHEELRSINNKILAAPDQQLIIKFAALLEDHIRFGERLLFNHIQKCFSESQLQNVVEKMKHTEIKEEKWNDSFWIKA